MAGRRDFSEFNARLERQLQRLPEHAQRAYGYAQKAQEKLQRYLPPEDSQRPNPLRRPVAPVVSITDVPVVAEARAKWARWNDPAAKLERRKRRTSRALTLWILLTLLMGLLAVATVTGALDVAAVSTTAFGAVAGAIVFGTFGVRSGLRLRRLNRTPVPVSATPPPLPPANSAAREPMERLAECEASLAELLRQMSTPTSVGTTAVSEISVEDARATAAEAANTLRALAARIQAIERARNAAPRGEREPLDSAVRTLREQLDDGLDGYGALVAAAGRAVAASGSGLQQSKEALTDATDHLAGLALALRELS